MPRQYTAQEMREAAEFFERNAEMVRWVVKSNSVLANIHETISMLRQAADAMEREEKRERKYQYGVVFGGDGIDRDYIFDSEECARTVAGDSLQVVRREVGEWEEVKDGK